MSVWPVASHTRIPAGNRSSAERRDHPLSAAASTPASTRIRTPPASSISIVPPPAQTRLRKPTNLKALTSSIDQLDWFSAREEGLGNLYEGLLEKNAADKKSGAGQYFTPRPLIDCIVRLMQPQPGETGAGPGGGHGGLPRRRRPLHQGAHRRALQAARAAGVTSSATTPSSARSWCRTRTGSA